MIDISIKHYVQALARVLGGLLQHLGDPLLSSRRGPTTRVQTKQLEQAHKHVFTPTITIGVGKIKAGQASVTVHRLNVFFWKTNLAF